MESEKSARTPRCAGSDICARHSKVNGFPSAVGPKFERCVARTPEKQKPVAQSAETVRVDGGLGLGEVQGRGGGM